MAASEKRLLGSRWASAALIHHSANSLFCRQFRAESEGGGGGAGGRGAGVLEAKKGGKCQWKREWGPHRSNLVEGEEGRNKRAGDVRRKKPAASQKQKSQLLESCSKQLVPKTEREDKVGSVWTGAGPEPKPEQADGKIII